METRLSIAQAMEHINDCLKRRGIITQAALSETAEGVCITVTHLNRHRQYVHRDHVLAGARLADPVTQGLLADYAVLARLTQPESSVPERARRLLRETAMYLGTDGEYHITGQPERKAMAPGLAAPNPRAA